MGEELGDRPNLDELFELSDLPIIQLIVTLTKAGQKMYIADKPELVTNNPKYLKQP